MKELIVSANDAGQRLDKFMQKAFPDLPLSLCYKYIRTKRVKVCGKRAQNSQRLEEGNTLQLYIGEDFLGLKERAPSFLSTSGKLDVVYEDDNLLLLNKPAGLLCHEDEREKRDTLVNRMQRYLFDSGVYQPELENSFVPALCNRIDRNTQGIVVAAKNAAALREMDETIRQRLVEKRYVCIALGKLPHKKDILRGWHTKDERATEALITTYRRPGAKSAITGYRVLEERGGLSLLEVSLHTGRTHQIRAHLASIGCPLLGDLKYGTARQNALYGRTRQALCSWALRFGPLPQGSVLSYLQGRTFHLQRVEFVEEYFPDWTPRRIEAGAQTTGNVNETLF